MIPPALRDVLVAAIVGAGGALASQFVTVAALKAEVDGIVKSADSNHAEIAQWFRNLSDKEDDLRDRVARIEGQLGAQHK